MQLNQYGPYVAKIQLRIKHNWHPPKLHESDCTNVTFKIQRNGSVTDLRLERPSGNIEADQAALRAIQSAAPFDPLPLRSDRLEMQFTFDYNLLNHGIQKKPL
jgi:TonB family protein